MGSYSSAEFSEVVGLYILKKITPIFGTGCVGLYRDDGLGILNESGPECDRKRKALTKIFQEEGLKLVVEGNLKQTDFLDVVLDLETGLHAPYRKPNDQPCYKKYRIKPPAYGYKTIAKDDREETVRPVIQ